MAHVEEVSEVSEVTAAGEALPGGEDFARLTDPFRPELLAYCYRMLGSYHDAEDQLQETLIRAWRSRDQFEGRASLRTWLYRIATNSCLRALENRARRPLPTGLGGPSDPDGVLAAARPEVPWLEPFPDALPGVGRAGSGGSGFGGSGFGGSGFGGSGFGGSGFGGSGFGGSGAEAADPAAIVASRADLRLALVAALQYLPGRQRAVLILRDVLRWRAAEVAALLGISTAAVNSALQRARAGLRDAGPAWDDLHEPAQADQRALLDQYAAALQNADVAALMRLLQADAVFEMPPVPTWFAGREPIGRFFAACVLRTPGDLRLVPVAANGQPAFAVYQREPDGAYEAHALQVLSCGAGGIAHIVAFRDPGLFDRFGLPPRLPA